MGKQERVQIDKERACEVKTLAASLIETAAMLNDQVYRAKDPHGTFERELVNSYVLLRMALRDCLHQAGVYSNPGWTDEDIVMAVATKLGVESRYAETRALIAR